MRLGVCTTHTPSARDEGPGWLPGKYRGGAELSDAEYLAAAPNGVEWSYTSPEAAHDYDRLLLTSVDHLSSADCMALAEREPVIFLHHDIQPTLYRRALLEAARVVMLHTPAQAERILAWAPDIRVEFVLSAIDTSLIRSELEREPVALAAARNHPLKGLKNAKIWAARNGYPIRVMTRDTRADVLDAMSRAEVFVHLPVEFESECRSVIEAVLSGCRVVTNENVGVTSIGGWDDPDLLRSLVDEAPAKYWEIVCR